MNGAADSAAPPARYRLAPVPEAPAGAPPPDAASEAAWIEPVLRANAVWFCQLRWLVVGVLLVVAATGLVPALPAAVGLRIQPLWPAVTAGVLAALNLEFMRRSRAAGGPGARGSIRAVLWAQIASDLVILTAVIYWVGPDWPAAPFMYLFHIILACLVFSPGQSLAVLGLAAGLYGLSLWSVSRGWLPASTIRLEGTGSLGLPTPGQLWAGLVPMLLVWGVIWYLVSRLAATLRRRELELAETNRRLAASSEERAQHMLQTTHQLKAPFAAIHAMTQVLLGGYAGELPPPAREVAGKIADRCLALSRQIQEMLQLANLRSRAQTAPPLRPLDLAGVVREVLGRLEPAARQRRIRLDAALQPAPVQAAPDHLTMLVDNLVVNAVTYSHNGGVVEVTCAPEPGPAGGARLTVRDHGIGIAPEKLPRIFDDYYRTEEAVAHNRASTGLGLAIVRQVARATGATLEVESAPGRGTTFTVIFPGAHPAAAPAPTPPSAAQPQSHHGLPADR